MLKHPKKRLTPPQLDWLSTDIEISSRSQLIGAHTPDLCYLKGFNKFEMEYSSYDILQAVQDHFIDFAFFIILFFYLLFECWS